MLALPMILVGWYLYLDALSGSGSRGALRRLMRFHVGYAIALGACHTIGWILYRDPATRQAPFTMFAIGVTGLIAEVNVAGVADASPWLDPSGLVLGRGACTSRLARRPPRSSRRRFRSPR